jgi:type IV pilus assembly protein PilP
MNIKKYYIFLSFIIIAGCSSDNFEDLDAFMVQAKATPGGRIEPIPTFAPYKPFDYGAISKRAPFDIPVLVRPLDISSSAIVDAPSSTRPKELLEQFNIETLRMVGSLEKDGVLWALLSDGQSTVHYVKNGNYLGKNHGRIVATTSSYIQVIEIISNGGNGWIERPRVIEIKERN